jgi:hypothetical protein
MRKVYICGTITKNPNYKEDFARAESFLKNLGFEPVNPVPYIENNLPERLKKDLWSKETHQFCMRLCIPLLLACDKIYYCNDIRGSKGAQIEKSVADACGIVDISCDLC